nr:hypothetical protein [Tanacetum cinerariifolium]
MIAILEKIEHNINFHQIVDFIKASHIRIETTNEETKILATVDDKPRTISESSLRRHLKLNDAKGISSLPDTELFENLSLKGYNILPNQRFTFQKGKFSHQWKFLIHTIMVTSLDADEGSMQQKLQELMDLYTGLQRQQTQMADKIKAQDLEISGLKARVMILEDKDRGREEPQEDALIKGGTVSVSPVAAATIVGVPTVSGLVPTVSAIFTTASVVTPYSRRPREISAKDKGKEKVVESCVPKKKKLQEQIDAQVAREIEEEFARDNQRTSQSLKRNKGNSTYFVPMSSKEEGERMKRKGLKLDQGSSKRMKTSEDVSEEDLKGMMQLVPVEEVYVEALKVKHPIIDWEIHSEGKKDY